MKRNYKLFLAAMALSASVSAQEFFDKVDYRGAFGTTDWSKPWANWTPAVTKYPGDAGLPANPTKVAITGKLDPGAGQVINWTNDKYYELSGLVEVMSGTLKIQEGTVIRGKAGLAAADKGTLLITKEAKLEAVGTAEKPIIFTSGEAPVMAGEAPTRNRGDWGGILLIGKAKLNIPAGSRQYEALPGITTAVYGGGASPDDMHSSGILKYVRIEFAGNNPSGISNSEINGLTLAGCGSGTKADYIQVSYSQDDSFEWFGGTTMHKYLIAFAGTDDDFDCDEGYRGKVQFALAVKHPAVFELTGTAASNGMELDNNTGLGGTSQVVPGINNPNPVTNVTFSNITMVGAIPAGGTATASLNATAATRFGAGVLMRTNNGSSVFNSIVTGYTVQLNLNHPKSDITPSVQTKADADSITIRNSIFGYGSGSSKFATSNIPTGLTGWGIKTWIVAGPATGVTGATGNDTSATTIPFKSGLYTGDAKGSIAGISFANVDYSLTEGAAYLTGASFEHPKLKMYLNGEVGTNDASETNLVMTVSPNPLSESASISTYVANAGNLNLSIMDMKGNVVAELVNNFVSAGTITTELNASQLVKGIYIARAITGTTVKTVKLVVK
jgi:hypothetical protein